MGMRKDVDYHLLPEHQFTLLAELYAELCRDRVRCLGTCPTMVWMWWRVGVDGRSFKTTGERVYRRTFTVNGDVKLDLYPTTVYVQCYFGGKTHRETLNVCSFKTVDALHKQLRKRFTIEPGTRTRLLVKQTSGLRQQVAEEDVSLLDMGWAINVSEAVG